MNLQGSLPSISVSVRSVRLSLNIFVLEQGFLGMSQKLSLKGRAFCWPAELIRRLRAGGHPERRVRDNAPYLAPVFSIPVRHHPSGAAAVSASSRSRACRETTPLPCARGRGRSRSNSWPPTVQLVLFCALSRQYASFVRLRRSRSRYSVIPLNFAFWI
jgi:hypothetical protein